MANETPGRANWHRTATLMSAICVLAAACSSPATTPSPVATAQPSTAPSTAPSPTPAPVPVQGISESGEISLGAWIAQSGPLAIAANIGNGAQAYLDTVNDAGGVNGYTFKFTVIDDGADPTKTVVAAKQLWEDDKVFALFQPYGSGPFAAVKQYIADNDIPTLFPGANPDLYFTIGEAPPANIFGYLPPYSALVDQLLTWAADDLGVKKLAVVHTNDAFGQAGIDSANALAESLGIEIVDDIGYDATETNYAPFGRRVVESGADATLVWAIPGSPQIISAAVDSGYSGKWLLNEAFRGGFFLGQIAELTGVAGNSYLNLYQLQAFSDDPALDDFKSVFADKYPDGDPMYALAGWTAAEMLVKAVEEATADGSPLTWESLQATFLKWRNVNVAAAVGISYTEQQHIGALKAQILRLDAAGWTALTDFEFMPGLEELAGN